MDNFIGRSIRNNFPNWSKIYKDDASVGSILFTQIGNEIEKVLDNLNVNLKSNSDPLKNPSSISKHIYIYDLKEFSYYKDVVDKINSVKEFKFFKYVNDVETEIKTFDTNSFTYQRFLSSYSEEFEKSSITDFENQNIILTLDGQSIDKEMNIDFSKSIKFENKIKFKKPKHLYIKVSEANLFYSKSIASRMITVKEEYFIILRGYDLQNVPVEETIFINENQIYKTKIKFSSICDISKSNLYSTIGGPCLVRHGFNGKVEVLNYPINYDIVKIDLKTIYKDTLSKIDSFYEFEKSKLYIENEFVNSVSRISYLFKLINDPSIAYNKHNGNIFYSLFSQNVSNLDNDEYIQDIEYNSIISKLMCITNKGNLLALELGMTEVKVPSLFNATVDFDIGIESLYQRYSLYDSAQIIVKHANVSTLINRIFIIYEKPDKSIFYIGFDSNDTPVIQSEPYLHIVGEHREVEKLWRQLTIDLNLDQAGQHNFYSLSLNPLAYEKELIAAFNNLNSKTIEFDFFNNIIQSYLRNKKNQKSLIISSFSLIAESNTPVFKYNTSISYNLNTKFGIYIENITNDIFIVKSSGNQILEMYKFNQKRTGVLIDFLSGEFYSYDIFDKYKLSIKMLNNDEYIYQRI